MEHYKLKVADNYNLSDLKQLGFEELDENTSPFDKYYAYEELIVSKTTREVIMYKIGQKAAIKLCDLYKLGIIEKVIEK